MAGKYIWKLWKLQTISLRALTMSMEMPIPNFCLWNCHGDSKKAEVRNSVALFNFFGQIIKKCYGIPNFCRAHFWSNFEINYLKTIIFNSFIQSQFNFPKLSKQLTLSWTTYKNLNKIKAFQTLGASWGENDTYYYTILQRLFFTIF